MLVLLCACMTVLCVTVLCVDVLAGLSICIYVYMHICVDAAAVYRSVFVFFRRL